MNRATCCMPADRTVSPDAMQSMASQDLLAMRLGTLPAVMTLNPVGAFSIGGALNSIFSGVGSVLGGGGAAAGAAASSGNWLNNLLQLGGTIGGLALAKEFGGQSGGSGNAGSGVGMQPQLVALGDGRYYNSATGQIIGGTAGAGNTGSTPSWVLPVAGAAGAGLLLYILLKKK